RAAVLLERACAAGRVTSAARHRGAAPRLARNYPMDGRRPPGYRHPTVSRRRCPMNRLSLCAGLAAAVLAGCASAPQATNPEASAPLGFTAGSQAAVEAEGAQRPDQDEAAQDLVVQGQVDAQDVHPGSQVVCRDMLQHASNVIRTRCMTRDAWKRYRSAEAQRAQAILRAWQGSPYAGF